MAITLLTVPQKLTPAYNPIVFRLSATTADYQQQGYKYWMKIQLTDSFDNPTFSKIYDDFITPNQFGEGIIDYSKIIQSFIKAPDWSTIDAPISNNLANQKWNNVKFKISYGFEKYVTYTYQNTTLVTINNKAYVRLNNTGSTLTFINGDQINITPDNPTQNEVINKISGIHTIVSATTSYAIIDVIIPAGTTLPTSSGVIEYADARRVRQITNQPGDIYQAFVSTFPFYSKDGIDFKNYDWRVHSAAYYISFDDTPLPYSNNAYFASSIPTELTVGKTEKPSLGINMVDYPFNRILVITRTPDYSAQTQKYYNVSSNDGFANIYIPFIPVSFTQDNIVTVYDDSEPVSILHQITFKIDNRCVINDYTLQFLDRRGGLSTFSFGARAYVNGKVVKKDYNKFFEDFSNTAVNNSLQFVDKYKDGTYPYQYTYDDAGRTQIEITETVEMELNTLNQQWTDNQNELWEELITSPYVYLITDGDYANRVNVQVKTMDYNTNTLKNKRLTSKKIMIEFSNKNNINI
jgi:hypothetical protein